MRIKILHEDRYGGEFLTGVIRRLKDKELVKNITTKAPKHIPALCDTKLDRILKAADNTCEKIVIVMDSDSPENRKNKCAKVKSHIPKMITPVKIVLMDYEIEEWICISKNLKWHSKPSDELKTRFKYTKSSLPKYASELDFEVLIKKKCSSFKSFLSALQP